MKERSKTNIGKKNEKVHLKVWKLKFGTFSDWTKCSFSMNFCHTLFILLLSKIINTQYQYKDVFRAEYSDEKAMPLIINFQAKKCLMNVLIKQFKN